MVNIKKRKSWLFKERNIGVSPFTHALSFLALLSTITIILFYFTGNNFLKNFDKIFAYYSFDSPSQGVPHVVAKNISQNIASTPLVTEPKSTTIEKDTQIVHQKEESSIPKIALYPLRYDQYQQYHSDGEAVSELISSLLIIKLSESDKFELVDRSMVSAIFNEKSLMLSSAKAHFIWAKNSQIT